MKSFSRIVFASYLLTLAWLILFKFSFNLSRVLEHQSRSLSLIPFSEFSRGNASEAISNIIAFIPVGLLLSVNFKQLSFGQKLSFILIFSLAAEIIQFALAIGISDTTDIVTNTFGGLAGLGVYALCDRYIATKKLDGFITVVITILLMTLLLLRLFVFRVRY